MITWKCKDCGAQARTGDDRERGPLCNGDNKHHPIRMVRADELGAGTPPDAGGEIVWRDPPPMAARGRKADEQRVKFIAALRTRPGAWALHPGTRKSVPSCSGLAKKHPGTEWAARKNVDGTVDLYGRWVGEPEISAA